MTDPLCSVTVYDQFKPGDRVRLVHVENREFVTDAALVVERDSTSATFANVPSRARVEVIVDRAASAPAAVVLEPSNPKTASVQYRILQEDTSTLTGWPVGPVMAAWSEWVGVEEGETLTFDEDVPIQMRAKPEVD